MSTPKPGRPKLFGKPDALLVDAGARIAMPPPPPATPPSPIPVPAPEPAPDPESEPTLPPSAAGPARVFIGVPRKAPAPRVAPGVWDEDTSDEAERDAWRPAAVRGDTAAPDRFSLGLDRPPAEPANPELAGKGLNLRLATSLEPADNERPRARVRAEDRPERRPEARPTPRVADPRPESLRLPVDPSPDIGVPDEPTPPVAGFRIAAKVSVPAPRAPTPPPEAPVDRPLWEDLPETGASPRPVVPVRREARAAPIPSAPATPAPPFPGRAASVTPSSARPERTDPGAPRARPANRTTVSAPVAPTRAPMPLTPPAPGAAFPPPGHNRPPLKPEKAARGGIGWAPWLLLLLGAVLAGAAWLGAGLPGLERFRAPGSSDGQALVPVPPTAPTEAPPEPEPEPTEAEKAAAEAKKKEEAAARAEAAKKEAAAKAAADRKAEEEAKKQAAEAAAKKPAPTGLLRIKCDRTAAITVDGKKRGSCPDLSSLELPVGRHTVRAFAGGRFLAQEVRIDLGAAREVEFVFE